jgi:hypothetical protein
MGAHTILPGTGRGTATRSGGVEGHSRLLRTSGVALCRACPSTILRMVPLPVSGRI